MRRIFAGAVALTLGSHLVAQDAARTPTVTLGPPTVSLGAPRSASFVQPVSFLDGRIARGKFDDKVPMPPGPTLQGGTPAAPHQSQLPPPSPMGDQIGRASCRERGVVV